MSLIHMPVFTIVWCDWTNDAATARDGFCGACGERGHKEVTA